MGGELVGQPAQNTPRSYTEVFWEQFPYYLAIGMTFEQYWQMDCDLVIAYRKAEKLKQEVYQERFNNQAWLQGMYFYDALCDAAPILRAFAKNGTRPQPYPQKPYALKEPADQPSSKVNGGKKQIQPPAMAFMENFMLQHNKRFEKTQEKNKNMEVRA